MLVNDLESDAQSYGLVPLSSVFFGGGTPSLMPPEHLEPLFTKLKSLDLIHPDTEITLEANPGTLDLGHLEGYLALGVNRLSIGVQSFNREVLKNLGRIHNRQQAIQMIEVAQSVGYQRLNVDLMHGTPGQTPEIAKQDLALISQLEISHLSWYQLTIEPNTSYFSDPPMLPDEDSLGKTELISSQFIESLDLEHYEVSAFAKPGEEAQHNLNYWQFGDYLGIGAGAHGKISSSSGVIRTQRTRQPNNYLARRSFKPIEHPITSQHQGMECLMNGLRLKKGISYGLFLERTGLDPEEFRERYLKQADQFCLLEKKRFQASELGWRHLNKILEMLV